LERNLFSSTPLGGNTYKHCIDIASKGKGKSGGVRIISFNVQQAESDVVITLMSIYDKSEISNVSDTYLCQLVKEIESKKENYYQFINN
jgi:hypothetical protein